MAEPQVSLRGSTVYRVAFLIFASGCLFNAFDSYVSHAVYYSLPPSEAQRQWDVWLYVALAFILIIECVSLLMFKRMKTQLKKMSS